MAQAETKEEREYYIIMFEKTNFTDLSLDPYGSFIIQKLFTMFEDKEFLFFQVIDNVDALINDQNGIRVVKFF
jgi:hypothetical protein